ncbi:MAG TPA: TonB family protein [Casimicrobiaceae bacterium]
MQASTFVRRTDAGSAELAAPAHGLSLTQRRFLTLLDTECRLDEVALRHPGPVDKLERDLARLTTLGLVVCETPYAANDAIEAVQPANEAMATPSTVRLGSRRLRPFAMVVSFAIIAVLAFLGWQRWASPRAPIAQVSGAAASVRVPASSVDATQAIPAAPAPSSGAIDAPVVTSAAIAPASEAALQPDPPMKSAEPRKSLAAAKPASPLAVRPSPSRDAVVDASATVVVPMPIAAAAPVPLMMTLQPMAPASVSSTAAPLAVAAPNGVPTPPTIAKPDPVPTQVARAAPAAEALRPAPPAPLVPVARETPAFPREALGFGIEHGIVRARLTIDAKGNVGDVEVVLSSHRAFDRAVREALARWRFAPGIAGRTTMVDVAFKRD